MLMAQTKEERLQMIKDAHARFKARQAREARLMAEMDKEGEERTENWNHWTDASSYANEYYGETFRNTTRYDNDWD